MAAPLRSAVAAQLASVNGANLGLLFDKCASSWHSNWRSDIQENATVSPKQQFFQSVADQANTRHGTHVSAVLLDTFHKRQQSVRDHLASRGWDVPHHVTLKTRWRFVSGLGISHPFETGMVFDHTMGVPFLPASSVKGAAHHWAEENNDPALKAIFGVPAAMGTVVFFDAYPEKWPKLEVDILNPHYGPYYQEQKPPGDWYEPKPVHFLAIAAGQAFRFAVAAKPGTDPGLAKRALAAVMGAAKDQGLGGKSGVGYGYFDE